MDIMTGGRVGETRGEWQKNRQSREVNPKDHPQMRRKILTVERIGEMERGGAKEVGSDRVASNEEGNAHAGRARRKGKWADRD